MAGRIRYAKMSTGFLQGVTGTLADVEVSITSGLPSFEIVGLCDSAIRESRNRVRSAIRHAGFEFPTGRITVGLSPAIFTNRAPQLIFRLPYACFMLQDRCVFHKVFVCMRLEN